VFLKQRGNKLIRKTSCEQGRVLAGVGGVLAVLGAILLASMWGGGSRLALADGAGSPAACDDTPGSVEGSIAPASADLATHSVDAGNIVTGVCIKSGAELGHTGPLQNGTYDGEGNAVAADSDEVCYEVSGVGTDTVTVKRVGEAGPECQGISHIDVLFEEKETPTATPTKTPEATATPTVMAAETPVATPTAVSPVITPPSTGSGGLAPGASSTSLLGLAVLMSGAGLLGWARRISNQR
jgi:hypothetical protein